MPTDPLQDRNVRFGDLEPDCRRAIWEEGIVKDVPKGRTLCREGDACDYLPLVISGNLRVFKAAENGREVTLYTVESGSSCVLSAAGILKGTPFPTQTMAETETRILLVPGRTVGAFYDRYKGWRNFILSLYTDRVSSVIHLVEEVLFRRLDDRLLELLRDKADGKGIVRITHQKIAEELGSTREVISRLLKELENRDILQQRRGEIAFIQQSI